MLAGNSDAPTSDALDLRIQQEILKQQVNNQIEVIAKLEQRLVDADLKIEKKDIELKQTVARSYEQKNTGRKNKTPARKSDTIRATVEGDAG